MLDSYMSIVCLFLPHLATNVLKIQSDCLQLPKLLNITLKNYSNEALKTCLDF